MRVAGSAGFAAVLALYLARTSAEAPAGLGLSVGQAAAWFALYLGLSFAAAAPAAWLARTVAGGLPTFALGCALMAAALLLVGADPPRLVWPGLVLAAAAGGLVRPALVLLVPRTATGAGARQHAALTEMQLAAAIGGIAGPLGAGLVDQAVGARAAFLLCAGFALVSVVILAVGRGAIRPLLRLPVRRREDVRRAALMAVGLLAAAFAALVAGARDDHGAPALLLPAVLLVVAQMLLLGRPRGQGTAARPTWGFDGLVLLSVAFWSGASLAGSVVSLLIEQGVDREVLGLLVPTEWFQMIVPLMALLAVPLLTRRLARAPAGRARQTRMVVAGVCLSACAFLILLPSAAAADADRQSSPLLPAAALALIGVATVVVNPTGQAVAVSDDREQSSRWVGLWYSATGLGALLGGLMATTVDSRGFTATVSLVVGVQAVSAAVGWASRRRITAMLGGAAP
jgi:POT family proton-dependent oligopeptide transporter